jgi:hypothetical protein
MVYSAMHIAFIKLPALILHVPAFCVYSILQGLYHSQHK